MKFIIKPQKNELNLILEAKAYKKVWSQNSRKILKAFRDITGLEFIQSTITAHVYDGDRSFSGIPYKPMRLQGNYRTDEERLLILVHELSHRLLGGNGLGNMDKFSNLEDHRRIYLFMYDVVNKAYGIELAERLETSEARDMHPDYSKAWHQAMSMTYVQRQTELKAMVKDKAVWK